MSDVQDRAAQLEAEAAQAAQRAAHARSHADAYRAAQARERDGRVVAWQRERLEAIDRRALRAAVVDAHEDLRQAVQADPLGRAVIAYLTAVMRERARTTEVGELRQLLRLAGPQETGGGGVRPLDARGQMLAGPIEEHALPLLASLIYAVSEATVEQETAAAEDDREAYVSDGGRLDRERRGLMEGIVAPVASAAPRAQGSIDVTGMTDADRQRHGLAPASTRTERDRAELR